MKKTCFYLFFAVSVLLAGRTIGQTDTTSNMLLMRTFEYYVGTLSSEIVLAHGNGKTETIELGSLKPKNREANTDKLHYVINKILKSGYRLLSAHSGGGDAFQSSTYLFIKEDR